MVGELHSLTDWHVSEASDDAELDDFYGRKTKKNSRYCPYVHVSIVCVSVCAENASVVR